MKVSNINNAPIYGAKFVASKSQNNNQHSTISVQNNMCSKSNVLMDKNYGVLQTRPMNISFKGGVPSTPIKPLSKKINNLFNVVRANDIILAGPSYDTAINSLKENVSSIKNVIKRVFYVEDASLDKVMGFKKNLDQKEVINLSDQILFIKDSKNQMGFLKKGESGYVLAGDTIDPKKSGIVITDKKEIDYPIKDSITMFVEFDEQVNKQITDINQKSLSQITLEKKEAPKEHKISFSDVGGMQNVIKELKKNILYPIKHPEIKNGKNMRKSILLYGPPGTGKSFVAEACANEAGAWYKKIDASELDSKWVGESEENWRNLFDEARKNQPSIIFIDEIDAIAKKRGGTDVYGDKTLNTILGLMSTTEKQGDEIYMIAATNKRELLDDAATRAGRFGLSIEVNSPDLKGTEEILDKYIANEPVSKDFNKAKFVEKLHSQKASGADIAAAAEDARTAAMDRERIFEKMDEGTYTPKDMENLTIKDEDFDKAFEILKNNRKTTERRPIGFNSSLYKK